MKENIEVGDKVKFSPRGPGVVTDITDAGYPQVDHVAVAWVEMEDGGVFDPRNVRPKLTASQVDKVIRGCFFKEGEDTTKAVKAKGIRLGAGFHPERLEAHRQQVRYMLHQLPHEFFPGTGDGYSFLKMCTSKEDDLWGQHRDCDALLVLGLALGYIEFMTPHECWEMMPGGMPYLRVKDVR